MTYFVCDKCGKLYKRNYGAPPVTKCECESEALWHFTRKEPAQIHSARIIGAKA